MTKTGMGLVPRIGRLGFLVAGLLLTAGACGAPDAPTPPPPAPEPAPPPPPSPEEVARRLHHGLDVSGHSGLVEWPVLVSEGHTFAFVKATEGEDLKDPAFDDNWRQVKEAGLLRGAYHFYVTEDDPELQADWFIQNAPLESGDLAPVVDIELIGHGTKSGLPERLRVFLNRLEAHFGVKPIIYTAPNFWDLHLTDEFGEYPLWVAEYDVDQPRLPKGWQTWHLWQWRGDAAVPGVEKGADLSRVNREGPVNLASLVIP